jgi:NADH:ubiquinone oxidoreductase subunit 3 (subunit A)
MKSTIIYFLKITLFDLVNQIRWSYLPPLMIYFSAGISGLTSIVGIFFIKDYLNLSASFLAGLGFWAGIPWALKMPLGHLVDLIWKYKDYMVFCGASIIAFSLLIMYGLIMHTDAMSNVLNIEAWYITSVILAPIGYMAQDVVADAMTVEAVPLKSVNGQNFNAKEIKGMHITMQTLGRLSIICGTVVVSVGNLILFSNADSLNQEETIQLYGSVYIYALAIPLVSVAGVFLASFLRRRSPRKSNECCGFVSADNKTVINWGLLLGSLIFVIFTVTIGSLQMPYAQETVFLGSLTIISFLMFRLIKELPKETRHTIVGTAIIIFVFRAVPGVGPGLTWFEIDELGFNESFLALLSLITSMLTLIGLIVLRPMIAKNSISTIITCLSIASAFLLIPSIAMYYGFHDWTASLTNGVVDSRFIAIINTALESPLGQISMIPLLAWIANNAPDHLKATFFAVFASFTNLALSASALSTKYINQIFIVKREVKNKITNEIVTIPDYSELGILLITVSILILSMPILCVVLINKTRLRNTD